MSRLRQIIPALTIAAGLAACAPAPEAGVADPDQFRATATGPVVTSARPATEVAACFEARATLLPMSSFADDPQTAHHGRRQQRCLPVGVLAHHVGCDLDNHLQDSTRPNCRRQCRPLRRVGQG